MSAYLEKANQYISDVLSGAAPACKFVQQACQRQRDDLARWADSGPYEFSPERAANICAFVELLPHIKGPKANARELIKLEPWQCFALTTVFGWLRRGTKSRRFRKVYIEVPRGNAKSTICSAVGLYMAFLDGESGANVFSVATKKEQAYIVFKDAQAMARRSPEFLEEFGVSVHRHAISQVESDSSFVALSSDDDTLDGLNVHLGIVDELHAHKTPGVHDVIETGIAKREQSMLWEITTAGSNRAGICYQVRSYVRSILDEGKVKDESYWGIIYTIDDEDDWRTEDALRKANPNWGVSVDPSSVVAGQRKAIQVASATNNFLTKHLNVWVNAESAWLPPGAWDACADESLEIEQFDGHPCWVGVDLASKIDIASIVALFPHGDGYAVFPKFYLPRAAVENGGNNAMAYAGWESTGHLTVVEGEVLDFDAVIDDLLVWIGRFDVQEIVFDPWKAVHITNPLQKRGVTVPLVEVAQNVKNLSGPMKELEALVLAKRIKHDGNPMFSWMASNVVCHADANGNVFPRKENLANKIDAIPATITGMSRAMSMNESIVRDFYKDELLTL